LNSRLSNTIFAAGITRKDNLVRTMRRMRALYGSIYDFVPRTYLMPREVSALAAHIDSLRKGADPMDLADDAIDDEADALGIELEKKAIKADGVRRAAAKVAELEKKIAKASGASSSSSAPNSQSADSKSSDSSNAIVSTTSKSDVIWIYKPASERRGNGIYVFRSVDDLKLDGAGVVQRFGCAISANMTSFADMCTIRS